MTLEGLWLDFMWPVLSFDAVLHYLSQTIRKTGLEALQPDVADVQGIPSIAEAYYLTEAHNEKVGLILLGNDGDRGVYADATCGGAIVMSC